MKTVIFALLVLLAVSQSESLRCSCGGARFCSGSEETCYGSDEVCATISYFTAGGISYSKGCMNSHACMAQNRPPFSARCCRMDLCNIY